MNPFVIPDTSERHPRYYVLTDGLCPLVAAYAVMAFMFLVGHPTVGILAGLPVGMVVASMRSAAISLGPDDDAASPAQDGGTR